jgi:hypothetical protein
VVENSSNPGQRLVDDRNLEIGVGEDLIWEMSGDLLPKVGSAMFRHG